MKTYWLYNRCSKKPDSFPTKWKWFHKFISFSLNKIHVFHKDCTKKTSQVKPCTAWELCLELNSHRQFLHPPPPQPRIPWATSAWYGRPLPFIWALRIFNAFLRCAKKSLLYFPQNAANFIILSFWVHIIQIFSPKPSTKISKARLEEYHTSEPTSSI
jgi:hypothetical protein